MRWKLRRKTSFSNADRVVEPDDNQTDAESHYFLMKITITIKNVKCPIVHYFHYFDKPSSSTSVNRFFFKFKWPTPTSQPTQQNIILILMMQIIWVFLPGLPSKFPFFVPFSHLVGFATCCHQPCHRTTTQAWFAVSRYLMYLMYSTHLMYSFCAQSQFSVQYLNRFLQKHLNGVLSKLWQI